VISGRRAFLSCGLAAAVWRLTGKALGDALAPAGAGVLDFEAAPARLQLIPHEAEPRALYAYNGVIPGPLIRLKQGDELRLRLSNGLLDPTTLSFPGLRAANSAAGIGGLTQDRLKSGASAEIRFVPPDAGFNLYLPHAGLSDPGHQGGGLFGPIVVEEAQRADVDLDAAVVLSDWNVDSKGQIKDDFANPAIGPESGRNGGVIFANGAPAPFKLGVRPGARVRLRLGNAATTRLTTIAMSGAKPFIVAVDGQPSEPFNPLNGQFPMGPGARFELMFDMPRDPSAKVRLAVLGDAGMEDHPFIAIASEGEPAASRSEPPRLDPNPLLPTEIALESARRCDFAVSGGSTQAFSVNGVSYVDWAPKPAYVIPRGRPAVFALANKTAVVQSLRLWGHVGRVLHSMDDGWEPYWRDTVLIQPGRTAHVAFVADNPGKWPLESAIPEHRVAGVGAWFQVG